MGCGGSSTAPRKGSLWADLKQRIPYEKTPEDQKKRDILYEKFDVRKMKSLSEKECLEGCIKHLELNKLTNELPTINRRAYKASSRLRTRADATDGVDPAEFRLYLEYLREYFELSVMFDEIDSSDDKKITLDEFKKATPKIEKWGLKIKNPEQDFKAIDKNNSGRINFKEFSEWAIMHKLDAENDNTVGNIPQARPVQPPPQPIAQPQVPKPDNVPQARPVQPPPQPIAQPQVPKPDNSKMKSLLADLNDRLPRKKTGDADLKKRDELFRKFDPNNNGYLSYAEVQKGAVEILGLHEFGIPLSPILLRAYNAARKARKGKGANAAQQDAYVERVEFRLLLLYIYDYFELFVMFDEIDTSDDKKVSLEEFKRAIPKIQSWGVTINNPEAEFKSIDKNGTGSLIFDEFCEWAAEKHLDVDGEDNI